MRQAGREYYEQVSEHPRPVGLFPHSLDRVNSPLFAASRLAVFTASRLQSALVQYGSRFPHLRKPTGGFVRFVLK